MTKSRSGRPSGLQKVNLAVDSGEVLAVLGPSGAGKTTLLRAIAGLEPIQSGSILLNGTPIESLPPDRRGIGFLFQVSTLLPHLTLRGNILLPQRLSAASEKVADVQEMAADLEIENLLERYPAHVSAGERQRASLVRSLICSRRLLLLDEPMTSLDAPLRRRLRPTLARLCRSQGEATIIVTHDPADAWGIADRAAILEGGTITQVGTRQELQKTPASKLVEELAAED